MSLLFLFNSARTSLVAQTVKCLPTMWETQVQPLGWENPLEKEMATHPSIYLIYSSALCRLLREAWPDILSKATPFLIILFPITLLYVSSEHLPISLLLSPTLSWWLRR